MARRTVFLVVGLALMMSVLGCSADLGSWGFRAVTGNGQVVSEDRPVSEVTSVALGGWGKLHIQVGEAEGLRIEADENLLEYIETEVEDGQLEIRHRRRTVLRPSTTIHYYLTVKALEAVGLTGAGDIEVPDIVGPRFTVQISGAGSVDMGALQVESLGVDITGAGSVHVQNLTADSLDVTISGAGDLSILGGEVRVQEIGIIGGGNFQAKEMQSAEARVRLSGLGNATVRVDDRLQVTISGAGSVRYVGSPTIEKNISGIGNVQQIGS